MLKAYTKYMLGKLVKTRMPSGLKIRMIQVLPNPIPRGYINLNPGKGYAGEIPAFFLELIFKFKYYG